MKAVFLTGALAAVLFSGDALAQGYCREYSQAVSIGGQRQSSYGVACMQPDGSWQVVSTENAGYPGGYGYAPPPPPMPAYVPTPVPVPVYRQPTSSFSLNIGVPYYKGRGDCDDRRWKHRWKEKHHHGHGHGHGRNYGWNVSRW